MNSDSLDAVGIDLLGFAGGGIKVCDHTRRPTSAICQQDREGSAGTKRLARYQTLTLEEILRLPVGELTKDTAHVYLWVQTRCFQRASPS